MNIQSCNELQNVGTMKRESWTSEVRRGSINRATNRAIQSLMTE
jgi:hypothetical protein